MVQQRSQQQKQTAVEEAGRNHWRCRETKGQPKQAGLNPKGSDIGDRGDF